MAKFTTSPCILLVVNALPKRACVALSTKFHTEGFAWSWDLGTMAADIKAYVPVDEAEALVAWLKEHGVEQER